MLQKKCVLLSVIVVLLIATVFAYNPPVNGENLFELTSPEQISGASSVAGGGIKSVTASSVVVNPALIAGEQRWAVDFDYTALVGSSEQDKYGQTLQIGLILPSRFFVTSFVMQGVFLDQTESMPLANTFTLRTAIAKDITDELYLGVGLYGGFGSSWALAGDIGFWYNIKQLKWLPFLKDIRWAIALTGMGKSYENDDLGLDGTASTAYPGIFTPRIGLAGDLFNLKKLSGGISMDLSFPTFQNVVFNTGMQFVIADFLRINTGWEVNLREVLNEKASLIPTVGLSCKFSFKTKDDSFLTKQGWQESNATISTAYQYMESGVNVVSASLSAQLGQEDTVAPEIILWEEE